MLNQLKGNPCTAQPRKRVSTVRLLRIHNCIRSRKAIRSASVLFIGISDLVMICHNHGKPICCSIFQRVKSCDSIIAGNHKACLFLQRFIDNSPVDSIAFPNPMRCLYGYLSPQTLQSFMENPPREYVRIFSAAFSISFIFRGSCRFASPP